MDMLTCFCIDIDEYIVQGETETDQAVLDRPDYKMLVVQLDWSSIPAAIVPPSLTRDMSDNISKVTKVVVLSKLWQQTVLITT